MLKLSRRWIAVVMIAFNLNIYSLPNHAVAKEGNVFSQNAEIETPQTRLSPEIEVPLKEGRRPFFLITEHKWWLIAGVSALAGGLILLNSSDNPDNKVNDTSGENNSGYGQISGKW